jgi:hypothetical protein
MSTAQNDGLCLRTGNDAALGEYTASPERGSGIQNVANGRLNEISYVSI